MAKTIIFHPIHTIADAKYRLTQYAQVFFILAGILGCLSAVALFRGESVPHLSTLLIYGFNARLLTRFQSRTAATLLLIYNGLFVLNAVPFMISTHQGILTALLSLVAVSVSGMALRESRTYHRLSQTRTIFNNTMAQTLLGFIYTVIFIFLTAAILGYSGLLMHTDISTKAAIMVLVMIAAYGLTFKGLLPFSQNRPITTGEKDT